MNPSRVTWLVFGTTMVLVSAVLVAAVFFINGSSPSFPRGKGLGGSGVVHVESPHAKANNPSRGARPVTVATTAGRRRVAARGVAAGFAASPGSVGRGPSTPSNIGSPPGQQYADSLQLLKAKLGTP